MIRIVNKTGKGYETEITDLSTGKLLPVNARKVVITCDVEDVVRAEIEVIQEQLDVIVQANNLTIRIADKLFRLEQIGD